MERIIRPARSLRGALRVPGDKSISHRALILGALARGRTLVRGLAPGLDVQSTRRCLSALGARFVTEPSEDAAHEGESVSVVGVGTEGLVAPAEPLDCGNSGTTIRLLTGVLSAADMTATLGGDESLCRRPMGRVAEPLELMGAQISGRRTAEGRLVAPLTVRGTARPRAPSVALPIPSAQVKSAVLLAGLRAKGRTVVSEPARSRDHTERMLRVFGVDVLEDGDSVAIEGVAELEAGELDVPADVSSAAFVFAAAAGLPGSRVILRDVGVNPGRTGCIEVLRAMGARVFLAQERDFGFEPVAEVLVEGPPRLRAAKVGGDLVPRTIDELVALSVLATRAEGTTEIRDAAELRVKESDRIAVVAESLRSMGARCETLPDGLLIDGPVALHPAEIDTHGDHRIAMAFSVAGLFAQGGNTTIRGAECADVSYPGFYDALEGLCEYE